MDVRPQIGGAPRRAPRRLSRGDSTGRFDGPGSRPLRLAPPPGGGASAADEGFERILATRPVLCTVGREQSGNIALAGLATDVRYILRPQPHPGRPSLHQMLVAKAAYAVRWSMPYFLWLGALDGEHLRPRIDCREPSTSNGHVFKALALRAIFKLRPSLEALVYADMDTTPYRPDVPPSDYLRLAPTADIFGATNPVKPVVLNTGVMLLRNTRWTHEFLAAWWDNRCGFMDQLSFWRTLFETWARDEPLWTYDESVFSTYHQARRDALAFLVESYHKLVPGLGDAKWLCRDDCRYAFELTGCLMEPVQLGKVLMLPVVPFKDRHGGENREPLRVPPAMSRDAAGYWGDDQWFCHANCHFPGAPGPLAKFKGRTKDPSQLKRCRKDTSPDFFACPCGEVARDLKNITRRRYLASGGGA
mmetsp:Transcript_7675/g.22752  ORF Transcript_7675/g.22752 Transcript_7675/m.22752 type:complete len:418 (+) Transcript_7675:155-1408(+)